MNKIKILVLALILGTSLCAEDIVHYDKSQIQQEKSIVNYGNSDKQKKDKVSKNVNKPITGKDIHDIK
jgi:hypothetical protein